MGCCITSHLDFDKGGCVTQVEWINVLCDNCQISLKQTLVVRT